MSEVVTLVWDDWEAVFVDGEKVASGHRGRVDRLSAVEGCTVEHVEEHRVFPEGGVYEQTLSDVAHFEEEE